MRSLVGVADLAPARAALLAPAPMSGPFLLLLAFLMLLLSNVSIMFPAMAPFEVPQWVAVAGIGLCLLEAATTGRSVRLVWPDTHLMVGFLFAGAVSCFGALWPRYAAEQTLVLAKMVAVNYLIVNVVLDARRMRTVFQTLAIGGLFPALGTLASFRRGELVEGRAAWIGIFANPNDLAYGLVVLLPFVVALAMTSRGVRRLAWCGCAALYAAAILVSYSRGGLVALLLVLLVAVARWGNPAVAIAVAWLGAILALAAPSLWQRQESFESLSTDVTLQQRLETVETGFAMFSDHPITGVGLGCSVIGWPLYAPADALSRKWLHIHNTPIQLLSETGILGTLAFGGAVAIALWRARKLGIAWRGRRGLHAEAVALELSLWGFLASGLTGGHLLTWFPYIAMGLVSALAAAARDEARP